ncbi:HK97 gp10 family phage protein [Pseudoalteromonas sp. Of7M-16]|uniref:HK97 gp10 family phage protein n=1 Tax=Pseudoalteromonas sp. Of7M-16 TaxID=2917756 RepID=UPI001EF4E322|nr:HK97 gp10 family phage protein [Pseudoalteromonas sp. Of7M-16]MCG7551349.1 HK97 gp10 family phage protein [Pseudoalteromonas sp. Of7M-16]
MKKFLSSLHKFERAANGLPEAIGPLVAASVQQNITEFSEPSNSPLTKRLKGNKGPLKDSGELRASITYTTRNDTLLVGTNKAHAQLLNDGGVIRAKKAKMLTIPATRQVKLQTNIKGVRGFLSALEAKGWSIAWRGGSVLGTPPIGQKGLGVKLPAKIGKDGKKLRPAYLLYYRKKEVEVPARRFMRLTDQSKTELNAFVKNYMSGALK